MKNYEIWDIMTKDHFKLATLLGDVKGKLDGDFESCIWLHKVHKRCKSSPGVQKSSFFF